MEKFQEPRSDGLVTARSLDQSKYTSGCWCVFCACPKHCRCISRLDYPFAKYDLHLADYSYTQEEYSRTLEGNLRTSSRQMNYKFRRCRMDQRRDGLSLYRCATV